MNAYSYVYMKCTYYHFVTRHFMNHFCNIIDGVVSNNVNNNIKTLDGIDICKNILQAKKTDAQIGRFDLYIK
ncbi:hypothetical protein DERF_001583 [Dermatophagoides farinae]|uniref:Uncharacterized protein n=1 Tax=Dermatophagoides farinae TaxID=6954 RepID=A0A922LD16_DERFA|nr:hypothetical protein DERF_001583 [Dermatophagoides farinae]